MQIMKTGKFFIAALFVQAVIIIALGLFLDFGQPLGIAVALIVGLVLSLILGLPSIISSLLARNKLLGYWVRRRNRSPLPPTRSMP